MVKVSDVMTHLVVAFRPQDSLNEVRSHLDRNRISGAPVIEAGRRVVGVISEVDLMQRELIDLPRRSNGAPQSTVTTVDGAMSHDPIVIGPDATISEAAALMHAKDVKRLPVVDEAGWLVGIVSRADLVRGISRSSALSSEYND